MITDVYLTDAPQWTWNIVIRNTGNGDAAASKTALIAPPESGERLIDTPSIAAGASVTVTAECFYGSVGQATVRADAGSAVTESDENNNAFTSAVGGTNGRCRYP